MHAQGFALKVHILPAQPAYFLAAQAKISILADIRAGRSVLVIDPKADLVNSILARVPEERVDDVVVIDPSDSCPVGFNQIGRAHV